MKLSNSCFAGCAWASLLRIGYRKSSAASQANLQDWNLCHYVQADGWSDLGEPITDDHGAKRTIAHDK